MSELNLYTTQCTYIREYGSTFYVGMARKRNGRPYISIASDELKSLVIYTGFNTHIPIHI